MHVDDRSPAMPLVRNTTAATRSRADAPVVVIGGDGVPLSTITRHSERPAGDAALVVVAVTGDVDQDSAPTLRATLIAALEGNPQVCCDVSAVAFFGAAGARALLDAHRLARAKGAAFSVRGARGLTRKILRYVGLPATV
jgi:anti-anti-sigma factor